MAVTDNYQSKQELYDAKKVFDTMNVDLQLTNTEFDGNLIYLLKQIKVDGESHKSELLKELQESLGPVFKSLEVDHAYTEDHSSWSVFYALKEIIDQISSRLEQGYKTVYRGQPGNWDLRPTLFRKGVTGYTDDFRRNYEQIYKSVAQKFPENVSYFSIHDNLDKRAANLAELQHYGLGTPLIDVSSNPFISLLFMVDGYANQGDEPQLDIFFVREDGQNSLYQEVVKREQNRRISVQKGAFLNFDKLDMNGLSGESKIPRVCLRLQYVRSSLDSATAVNLPDGDLPVAQDEERVKVNVLATAVNDIKSKLNSYYYRTEDLFPDFYMYLGVLKAKYADTGHVDVNKWYQVVEN
ncbi:FRG domain-containing protein [Levilactobacillus parabrevis]|uniref:FRG domain-containing protein n=1 Tax=Levilactobacillus parabrevis TaxID=357278 RepID=UPI0021A31CDB|nr:FRG domain-containing protein [Levilactobacillus parabrevis]MCT4486746.1 FRG domain-containing protein [Levilactobacillus parabrevis]MCT4489658.1 FRG domain-containing protein [Levilactobacillus parabrevis]